MKIAIVWSSPNRDGLTAAAKNSLMDGLRSAGCELEELWLNGLQLEHCRACGNGFGLCRAEGRCVIGDDFAGAYETLQHCDGVVFVTAVYWHNMTECLKAFIDRLRRMENSHGDHRLAGKPVLLTACAGGTGNGAIQCLNAMEECMRHMELKTVERLPVIRFNRGYMLPALAEAGRAFAALIAQ